VHVQLAHRYISTCVCVCVCVCVCGQWMDLSVDMLRCAYLCSWRRMHLSLPPGVPLHVCTPGSSSASVYVSACPCMFMLNFHPLLPRARATGRA
jgi:hypothetical protein